MDKKLVMSQLKSVLLVDDDVTTNYLNKLLLTRLGVAEELDGYSVLASTLT